MRRGSGLSDCRHGRLAALGPHLDVQIVRFIHEAEDDLVPLGVVRRELLPQAGEDLVTRAPLANDSAVVPRKVVQVEHAVCAGIQTSLNQLVEIAEIDLVQPAGGLTRRDVLPAHCFVANALASQG